MPKDTEWLVDTGLGVLHWYCICKQPNAIQREKCINCDKLKPSNLKVIGFNHRGKPWGGRGRKPKNWNGQIKD